MQTDELQGAYGTAKYFRGALKYFSRRTHKTAKEKGFYGEPVVMDKVAGKIALIHSECSELLEALRKDQGAQKVTEETIDIIIRTVSLHEWLVEIGLATDNLDETMHMVMTRNDGRPSMHGHRWG